MKLTRRAALMLTALAPVWRVQAQEVTIDPATGHLERARVTKMLQMYVDLDAFDADVRKEGSPEAFALVVKYRGESLTFTSAELFAALKGEP